MKTQSAGPFTRCGNASLEEDAVKVTYDTSGVSHTVFIRDLEDLRGNHDTPPVKVFVCGPDGNLKAGYAHRSPSGRALLLNTTTSNGNLTVEWASLQKLLHRKRNRVPVSRINIPSL